MKKLCYRNTYHRSHGRDANGNKEWCCAALQVDVLKLTVERLGSACKGLRTGTYRNLESLTVTHVVREDDVQVCIWFHKYRVHVITNSLLSDQDKA